MSAGDTVARQWYIAGIRSLQDVKDCFDTGSDYDDTDLSEPEDDLGPSGSETEEVVVHNRHTHTHTLTHTNCAHTHAPYWSGGQKIVACAYL